MRELSTIDVPKGDAKQPHALEFTAQVNEREAKDKATRCSVAIEATYDGINWQHVAGYESWTGGETDFDGNPAVPTIIIGGEKRPLKYRVVTNAKAESSLAAGKMEAKDTGERK